MVSREAKGVRAEREGKGGGLVEVIWGRHAE